VERIYDRKGVVVCLLETLKHRVGKGKQFKKRQVAADVKAIRSRVTNKYSPLKCEIELTYLIFVAAIISIHDCWSSIPQGLVDDAAQSVLFDSRQVLQDIQSVLEISIRLD